ncbi:MAG: AAA family ATPase [Spirochaetaceae bacterium]|nr:AAA family ATPase [Spirochaetaceae bacterium]
MSEQLIKKNSEFIKILPAWAQELAIKYCSKTANLYILNGNIRDFLPNKMYEGKFEFVRIQEFISDVLFGNEGINIYFDRSSGVNFLSQDMQKDYLKTLKTTYPDICSEEFLSSDPTKAFRYLEKYFLMNLSKNTRIVLIIDYAETIVANSDIARMSDEDRYSLVTLNRWSQDPIFTKGDISVILLTENLSDISPRLVRSPSTIKINIPIPDEKVRTSFLTFKDRQNSLILEDRLNIERVSKITSGLNLINLNQLAAESFEEDKPISLEYLKYRKKEIIENEALGLLEFIETEHDLSMVSGHEFVKKRFKNAAKAIKQGRLDVLPMGYLISGPVGTGKSFMVTAFAGDIGIPIVKLKNFRSKWQGASEANFEKVLNILKAMAPVGVLIDEADAFLGSRNQDGVDSGTSNRIFAQLASFMGNTDYRGKIIWFLITSRPDLLPIDLKRQGRAEEHLALFYPDTNEEREDLFETLIKKLKIKVQQNVGISDLLKKYKLESSGADIEAILIRAKFNATMNNHVIITKEDLEETIRDFAPPTYPYAIELQNLVAVIECTSKEMVPKKFQNLDRSKLVEQIREIKLLLGEISE